MPSLSERLKSLGVKVGAHDLAAPASGAASGAARVDHPYSIEKIIPGREVETPAGPAFVIETRYPVETRSGQGQALASAQPRVLRRIARWAGDDRLHEMPPEQLAFLDTETSGLSGGTGTLAFLVGVGRFSGNEFHLAQYFLREPAEEAAMLLALEVFLAPCAALTTFNGKAFDAPLLNTRYTLQGWHSPLLEMAHIDLLPLARRLWRESLPSRTLGNLEVHILGYSRSDEEVPGWMIPQLYFEYLHSGDARQMKNVLYHNAVDVISMTALLDHMARLVEDPLDASALYPTPTRLASSDGTPAALYSGKLTTAAEPGATSLELVALARLCEDLGEVELAVELYQRSLAPFAGANAGAERSRSGRQSDSRIEYQNDNRQDGLPEDIFWDSLQRLALLHKRRGTYEQAIPLWEKAAQKHPGLPGLVYAHIELAKAYEHVLRDAQLALHWTSRAIEIVQAPAFPVYERRSLLPELEHRLQRLQRKLGNRADSTFLSSENQ